MAAQHLLVRGDDVHAKDSNGDSPLHLASRHGHGQIAALLLDQGADPESKNHVGYTPLHCATLLGHYETAKVLLEHGADVQVKDSNGDRPPLHLASRHGHDQVATLLLEHGADVHVKDSNGDNPLHLAARYRHDQIATLLLDHGADPESKNTNGQTPVECAGIFSLLQNTLTRQNSELTQRLAEERAIRDGLEARIDTLDGLRAVITGLSEDIREMRIGKTRTKRIIVGTRSLSVPARSSCLCAVGDSCCGGEVAAGS